MSNDITSSSFQWNISNKNREANAINFCKMVENCESKNHEKNFSKFCLKQKFFGKKKQIGKLEFSDEIQSTFFFQKLRVLIVCL